jgi:hypothetical protein
VNLGPADTWLFIEAVFWLALARFAILTIPFRWSAKLLNLRPDRDMSWDEVDCDTPSLVSVRRIRRILKVASARTPWKSTCLTLALAGVGMLRFRHLAATMALGVMKNAEQSGGMEAHAWLSTGGFILTGARERGSYRVIATFTYEPKCSHRAACDVPILRIFSKH